MFDSVFTPIPFAESKYGIRQVHFSFIQKTWLSRTKKVKNEILQLNHVTTFSTPLQETTRKENVEIPQKRMTLCCQTAE